MPGNTLSRAGSLALYATTRYRSRARSSRHPLPPNDPLGIIYDVPFCQQPHANMCGDAAATMVVSFGMHRGAAVRRAVRRTLRRQPRPTGLQHLPPGLNANDMCNAYDLVQVHPALNELRYYLLHRGPLVVSGELFGGNYDGERENHYCVLKGVWGQFVIIDDPWQGRDRRKPAQWMHDHWHDTFAFRGFQPGPAGRFDAGHRPSAAYLLGQTADLR
jgi:hypothetical protein